MPILLSCCRWPPKKAPASRRTLIGGGLARAPLRLHGRPAGLRQGTRALLSTTSPCPPTPPVAPRRRVGVMGGTFDPIHHGHLVAASEVQAWFDLDEVVFVPTGEPWQKSDRVVSPGRAPLPDDRDRDGVQPPVHRVPRGHRPRRSDVHDRHAARPRRERCPTPTSTSSPVPTRWPRSSPGATPTSCSSWRASWAAPGPATRWTPSTLRGIPRRPGHDPGDPRAGDLLHRVPRAPGQGRAGVVPRARRRRAVHRQARPLRRPRPGWRLCMTATEHAIELVHTAARAASDKLAENILAFDVSEQLVITDAFLLCSASNERQVQVDRRRDRGQAPRDRRQARTPRGRARRSLGADRLRRDRGARAARRGARVLRARAALARLPGDPAARRRDLRPWPLRPTGRVDGRGRGSILRAARPDRLERRGPGPGPRRRQPRRRRPQPGRGDGSRSLAELDPALLVSSDLARARETAAFLEKATGLTAVEDPRLREYDAGRAHRPDPRGVRRAPG